MGGGANDLVFCRKYFFSAAVAGLKPEIGIQAQLDLSPTQGTFN